MKVIEYNRAWAVNYAKKWALSRNNAYYDFSFIGGDCTNFASQCLLAGVGVMNYTKDVGWYYRSPSDRAAAWSGVEYFYSFLTQNAIDKGVGDGSGPFAEEVDVSKAEIGDFIQLMRDNGDFYHTLIVVDNNYGRPVVAAHSFDAYAKPLSAYFFFKARALHILGARIN